MRARTHSSGKSLASRRHGISNAHAFAVGKATGVRINASHAANTGAALHNAKKHSENARKRFRGSSTHTSSKNRFTSTSTNTETITPPEISINPENLPNLKYFYLLLIPFAIFFIIIFIVIILSIARII